MYVNLAVTSSACLPVPVPLPPPLSLSGLSHKTSVSPAEGEGASQMAAAAERGSSAHCGGLLLLMGARSLEASDHSSTFIFTLVQGRAKSPGQGRGILFLPPQRNLNLLLVPM